MVTLVKIHFSKAKPPPLAPALAKFFIGVPSVSLSHISKKLEIPDGLNASAVFFIAYLLFSRLFNRGNCFIASF